METHQEMAARGDVRAIRILAERKAEDEARAAKAQAEKDAEAARRAAIFALVAETGERQLLSVRTREVDGEILQDRCYAMPDGTKSVEMGIPQY